MRAYIICKNTKMNSSSFQGGRVDNKIHSFDRDQFREDFDPMQRRGRIALWKPIKSFK